LYLTKKKEAKRPVAKAMEKKGKKTIEQRMSKKSEVLKRSACNTKPSYEGEKDIIGIPCIRSKDRSLKISSGEKMKAWKKYLEELLNQENEWGAVSELRSDEN